MIKLFKNKESKREVVEKTVKYVVYTEPLAQDGSYLACRSMFESKLYSDLGEAKKYAESNSKYFPSIVAEIKPLYKYKSNPIVEILND